MGVFEFVATLNTGTTDASSACLLNDTGLGGDMTTTLNSPPSNAVGGDGGWRQFKPRATSAGNNVEPVLGLTAFGWIATPTGNAGLLLPILSIAAGSWTLTATMTFSAVSLNMVDALYMRVWAVDAAVATGTRIPMANGEDAKGWVQVSAIFSPPATPGDVVLTTPALTGVAAVTMPGTQPYLFIELAEHESTMGVTATNIHLKNVSLVTPSVKYVQTVVESLSSASDTSSRVFAGHRTMFESVGAAADVPSRIYGASRMAAEAVGPSNDSAISRLFHGYRLVSETVGPASDPAVSRLFNGSRLMLESVGPAGDALVSRIYNGYRMILESVGPAVDLSTRKYVGFRLILESVGPAVDSPTRVMGYFRLMLEAVGPASDAPSRTYKAIRLVLEAVGPAGDTVSRLFTSIRLILEAVGPSSDVPSRLAGFKRTELESVGPSIDSSVSRLFTAVRLIIENLTSGGAVIPDWPLNAPVKHIAGPCQDEDSGAVMANCAVWLMRDSDLVRVQTTTSDGSGNYSFARGTDDPYTYTVIGFSADGTKHAISDRGLVPA